MRSSFSSNRTSCLISTSIARQGCDFHRDAAMGYSKSRRVRLHDLMDVNPSNPASKDQITSN